MLTIKFSECLGLSYNDDFQNCHEKLPIRHRCRLYEHFLEHADHMFKDVNVLIHSHDEYLILIAQHFFRLGNLKNVKFISVCGCEKISKEYNLTLDSDGDFTEGPYHGFFNQRLKYLR